MRTEFLKAELAGMMFAMEPRVLEEYIAVLNEGVPRLEEETRQENTTRYEAVGNVGVISVSGDMYKKDMTGMCGESFVSYPAIIRAIDAAEADPAVDTAIFRVDTHGGVIEGVDEVNARITNSPLRTVTMFENNAMSGGVWAFMASDEVYATETTLIGSIGVMAAMNAPTAEDETAKKLVIVSKNAENKNCALKGDCKEKAQAQIDHYEEIFYSRVTAATGFSADEIKATFQDGGTIFASAALEAGFIDGVTTFDQVLANLATMPTVRRADKIAISDTGGETMPDLTQESLDAVQGQLDAAIAQVATHEDTIKALNAQIEGATASAEAIPEIVAMAFDRGVSKDTALKMVAAGSKEKAALVMVESLQSGGATTPAVDVTDPEGSADAAKEEAGQALAKAIAGRLSAK